MASNSPSTQLTPLLLKIEDAAAIIATSRATLYELLRRGELRSVHIGRSVRVPLTELEAFVARRLEDDGAL